MKRKIIRQGHNTMTITLPSDWIKKFNLVPGDEIDVSEVNNELVVSTEGNNGEERKTTIDITNFRMPLLWRFFQGPYREGYDEITIKFDPNKEYQSAYHYYTTQFDYANIGEHVPKKPAIDHLQTFVDRFIGMEIIETGKDHCVIREMGEVSPKEFENSLRRIFLVILQLFDRLIEIMEDKDKRGTHICKEIHTMDLNVDRFVDYCSRIMNKRKDMLTDNKKSLIFSTLYILELVGDEMKYVGKHLAKDNNEQLKEAIKVAKKVKQYFELFYDLFYKFSRERAIVIGEYDYNIYQENFNLKKKIKGEERSIVKHFMMVSKLIFVLFELRVEMEFADH
ncbi:MAG: AbrB/MazE/SpoVT family DNA-binding domain-containing protein [archaeon]